MEQTKPLLRPNQVQALEEDIRGIEAELNAPPFIRNQIQDLATKQKQLKQIKGDLETQRPTPYSEAERDDAVKEHNELLDRIVEGMPTQAEMRRRPAGAVDKHMGWERRNKNAILKLKNMRLRMLESGMISDVGDASEVANLERFRPQGGSQELNMDGTLIEGKNFHLPPPGSAPPVTMSDEHKALLQEVAPDLAEATATMDNVTRTEVIERLDAILAAKKTVKRGPSEWNRLQARARELGVEVYGKKRDELEAEIAAKETVAPVEEV